MYTITHKHTLTPVGGAQKVATVEEAEAIVIFARVALGEDLTYVKDEPTPEQEAEHARLLKALQSARNYSYEANMGDYSMASIKHAKAQVDAAKQALIDAGYEVPTW